MIEVAKLSDCCFVRRLTEDDAGEVLAICRDNPQFYRYCEAEPTINQVLNDMTVTPPGVDRSRKFFVGFYDESELVAVMDLIDGYPSRDVAYIGFFMMNMRLQGRQIGSSIVSGVLNNLKTMGFSAVRLGIDKDNPQSTHFWKKNGFVVIRETEKHGWPFLEAEKRL